MVDPGSFLKPITLLISIELDLHHFVVRGDDYVVRQTPQRDVSSS